PRPGCTRRGGSGARRNGPVAFRDARAYERATTACAFSASGAQLEGISAGTTPYRYFSSPTTSTTRSLPATSRSTLSAPRYGRLKVNGAAPAMNVSGAVSGCAFVPGPSGTRRPGPNLTFGEVTTCTFPRPSLTLNGVVEVI